MLRYQTIPVTAFAQNCSLVWDDASLQAAVIDPGGDLDRVLAEVTRLGLKLEQIWLTHAHIDHAGGTGELAQRLGLHIMGPHPADQFWIDGLPQQSRMFGFPQAQSFTPTRWLHDGDQVNVARMRWKCATARATRLAMWCFTRPTSSALLWVTCFLRAA